MSVLDQFPPHWGIHFTPTIHAKPEGPTDPRNVKLHSNFVACITGTSRGLGYYCAVAYARAGVKGIAISSRTQADLDKLSAELREVNPEIDILSQTCDTQKDADVKSLADATWARFGRLDVVVANAGIISKYIRRDDGKEYMPVGIVEDSDFERVIDTNFMGSYRVAKHFVPLLEKTGDGVQAYVVITSIAAHQSSSEVTSIAYNLSKIGNNKMAEHIHNDHHEKSGVQAFAVHPGAVLTPQTEAHHTTQKGDMWTQLLTDDIELCGGFLTWLTAERRDWLSGRYLSVNWDTKELYDMKDDIVKNDKLTMKMVV